MRRVVPASVREGAPLRRVVLPAVREGAPLCRVLPVTLSGRGTSAQSAAGYPMGDAPLRRVLLPLCV